MKVLGTLLGAVIIFIGVILVWNWDGKTTSTYYSKRCILCNSEFRFSIRTL